MSLLRAVRVWGVVLASLLLSFECSDELLRSATLPGLAARMSHCEREAWFNFLIPGAIILIGLASTVLGVKCSSSIQAARVDACLDSGGSYDYETEHCDHETSHPVP